MRRGQLLNNKYFLIGFLLVLVLIDFLLIPNLNPVCRSGQGYGFGYSRGESIDQLNRLRVGIKRVGYNFSHFFIFWQQPAFSKTYHNLSDFLQLDTSPLFLNILHFFAFLIFVLILFYFFHLNFISAIFIIVFFNISHEYIAEGRCMDPSFNDLWIDVLGSLVGVLIYQFMPRWPFALGAGNKSTKFKITNFK